VREYEDDDMPEETGASISSPSSSMFSKETPRDNIKLRSIGLSPTESAISVKLKLQKLV
jgi:hypothetical protein